MKTISVFDEVQMYIFMLEELKHKIYTNNQELQSDLREEFNVEISESDISKVYEPIVEEDVEDLQIMLRNIYSY